MSLRKNIAPKSAVAADQKKLADCWNPTKKQRTGVVDSDYQTVPICPVCNTKMWKDDALNNLHIDACLQRLDKMSAAVVPVAALQDDPLVCSLKFHTVVDLPGLIVIPNFITEEEEADIIKFIDDDRLMSWKFSSFNGDCYSKYFGVKTQFEYL